jgi:glycyl-tRNA synthetase beta chain
MAKDLLFEIGLEEVPARFVRNAVEQLNDKMTKWLKDARIEHSFSKAYATPRRITVLVESVEEKQEDIKEEVKGPSKKIALDTEGEWSKAALGFARSQGVDPSELFFQELGGVEYVYAVKHMTGVETESLLSEALMNLITSMTFPKNMRWGSYDLKFVRPIRWIVALFGDQIIPLEITNVKAGRISRGHRFLGNQELEIPSPNKYVELLRKEFVYVDLDERKHLITQQIEELAVKQEWNVSIKEDLLEEVLFLVEFPTVLFGSFDPDFLQIPQEVLITSMREHQRYFPVLDKQGHLLPHFITVRNGNSVSLEQVAKGNEKVLRARLSDARFFYQEDHKLSIDDAIARLDKIVFHEELGTVGDKVRRIRSISEKLVNLLQLESKTAHHILRTAEICKFDLVTQMVYEFPELQGVMGEDYALKANEEAEVARAIFEHYQPRYSGDDSPASIIGAVVSMADKIDTIVGCFSIGIIPTGSQDPYALRRQAAGIVQILQDHQCSCVLSDLFNTAMSVYKQDDLLKREENDIRKDLFDFFALRVKNILSDQVRYDVVDAVMSSGFDHISSVIKRGQALMDSLEKEDMKSIIESFNRVSNLASKADSSEVDPSLFTEQVEHELFDAWSKMKVKYIQELNEEQEKQALETISNLMQPINSYFDQVMVMVDDQKIKQNRLGLLSLISKQIQKYADFQKIVM